MKKFFLYVMAFSMFSWGVLGLGPCDSLGSNTRAVAPIDANAQADNSPQEIEIVTAVIPPYSYIEDGIQKGLIVEIVEAMAKHTGHSGKIKFLPWKRALHDALSGGKNGLPARLIIPLNRSDEREFKFSWVQELYVDDTVFVTKKGITAKIERTEQALNLPIGVLLGSPLEAQLRRLGFKNIEAAVDEETNARKLNVGRVAVWHVARMVAPFVFSQLGFSTKDLEYSHGLEPNDLYLGGSKGIPTEVVNQWQAAMKKIKKDGSYAKIVQKYTR